MGSFYTSRRQPNIGPEPSRQTISVIMSPRRAAQAARKTDKAKAMDIATSIRGARVSDHAQLQALFEELDRLHRDGAPWLLKKPDRDPRPLEWLHTLLANHDSALFVADVGACVGLATRSPS
jgi:hypothetical protein